MAAPDIKKMVLNRLPYLQDVLATQNLIIDFKTEWFYDLQLSLGIADADVEDETKYSPPKRQLIADLVAIAMIERRGVLNMEGENGAAATGNKILKRAKAGEAEAEFMLPKAEDGGKLTTTMAKLLEDLKKSAIRRAANLGFILDIQGADRMLVAALSSASPIINVSLEDCEEDDD